MEPTTKNCKTEKLKSKNGYARSNSKIWSMKLRVQDQGEDPKRTWQEVVREDCRARKLNKEDAVDRCKWRKVIKEVR